MVSIVHSFFIHCFHVGFIALPCIPAACDWSEEKRHQTGCGSLEITLLPNIKPWTLIYLSKKHAWSMCVKPTLTETADQIWFKIWHVHKDVLTGDERLVRPLVTTNRYNRFYLEQQILIMISNMLIYLTSCGHLFDLIIVLYQHTTCILHQY